MRAAMRLFLAMGVLALAGCGSSGGGAKTVAPRTTTTASTPTAPAAPAKQVPSPIHAVTPMPLISRGVPAYSGPKDVYPASNANDRNYGTAWRATPPTWLAYDLSSVPSAERQTVDVVWYNDATGAYDHTIAGSDAYNNLGAYTIDANAGAGGGSPPRSGWVTLASVTHNVFHSRQALIKLTGYNWLRIEVTTSDGSPGNTDAAINMDVYDASKGETDDWIFFGDSITAGAMIHDYTPPPNFAQTIHATRPAYFPLEENGGIGYQTSGSILKDFTAWVAMFPGHFVSIAYGTNDANNGNVAPAQYYTNLKLIVRDVLAAGKVPVIPRIPYGCTPNLIKNVPRLNAEITALYAAYPRIVHGPDFYTYFKHNRRLISQDCIHPSDPVGMQAYRTLYATTMLTAVYGQ